MKRRYDDDDDDYDERPAKRGSGGKGGSGGPGAMPCVLKLLAPEVMASAVIGKGGAVISAMRQSTGGRVGLTEHNEFFPGTNCRVLTAGCPDEESLTDLAMKIIDKVVECARDAPGDDLGSGSEVKLRTLVPRAAVGGIIGKGGHRVKELRESTGAKIHIEEASSKAPGADQIVTLTGSQGALETIVGEIIRQVVELGNEDWFESWATTPGAEKGSKGGGKGGGGRKGDGGRDRQERDWDDRDYGHRDSRDYGRDHHSRDADPPPRSSRGKGGGHSSDSGSDLLLRVVGDLPSYVKQDSRGFAMSCVVPNRLVGGLIGKSGVGTKEVQSLTDTKIAIREIPGDSDNRALNISGPLTNSCAAFMLMMKRYLDAEAQEAAAPRSEGRSRR